MIKSNHKRRVEQKMDNETRTTLLNICSVLTELTAVCRQINSDNERLLEENYLMSQELKLANIKVNIIIESLSGKNIGVEIK